MASAIDAAREHGRTVVLAVTFTRTVPNRDIRLLLSREAQDLAHLATSLTPSLLPVGDATGWPEPHSTEDSSPPAYSAHLRHGVYVQPATLDRDNTIRHELMASRAGDTKFILFSPNATRSAQMVPLARLHALTAILRGVSILPKHEPHSPMGMWWAGAVGRPLIITDLPHHLDVQTLMCLRRCAWEASDVAPPIDSSDSDDEAEPRSRVGRHRHWLRSHAACLTNRVPSYL